MNQSLQLFATLIHSDYCPCSWLQCVSCVKMMHFVALNHVGLSDVPCQPLLFKKKWRKLFHFTFVYLTWFSFCLNFLFSEYFFCHILWICHNSYFCSVCSKLSNRAQDLYLFDYVIYIWNLKNMSIFFPFCPEQIIILFLCPKSENTFSTYSVCFDLETKPNPIKSAESLVLP